MPIWLVLAAVPAALTEPSHALRNIAAIPPWLLLASAGASEILQRQKARRGELILAVALVVAIGAAARPKLTAYFTRYGEESAVHWQFGYRQGLALARQRNKPCTVLSDRLFLPHIFVLFYWKMPPEDYQVQPVQTLQQGEWRVSGWQLGSLYVDDVAKRSTDPHMQSCVYLTAANEVDRLNPAVRLVVESVYAPNGQPVLLVASQ